MPWALTKRRRRRRRRRRRTINPLNPKDLLQYL
jgi:hypothetical protein